MAAAAAEAAAVAATAPPPATEKYSATLESITPLALALSAAGTDVAEAEASSCHSSGSKSGNNGGRESGSGRGSDRRLGVRKDR